MKVNDRCLQEKPSGLVLPSKRTYSLRRDIPNFQLTNACFDKETQCRLKIDSSEVNNIKSISEYVNQGQADVGHYALIKGPGNIYMYNGM